jgi:hypothetical protein
VGGDLESSEVSFPGRGGGAGREGSASPPFPALSGFAPSPAGRGTAMDQLVGSLYLFQAFWSKS